MHRPLRVAFYGEIGSGNTGNDGSFEVILDWLRRGAPDAEIFAICLGPDQTAAHYGIPTAPMRPRPRGQGRSRVTRLAGRIGRKLTDPARMYSLLHDTDWVIVPGAGVLESSWHRPWMMPYGLFGLTLAARIRGTRVALVNVGADRSESRLSRWLVAHVARRADYLTLRDQRSATSLQQMGVRTSPDMVYPDLAFGLRAPSARDPRSRCIGVGLVNYFSWRGHPEDRARNEASYEQTMISLVEWLLDQSYCVRLLTGDRWDDQGLQRVLRGVRARHPGLSPEMLVGEPARDLHQLMKQMQDVEVVVGARYHNIVMALRLAKPVLALSYAPKATQAMERFAMSRYSQPIDGIDLPKLKLQLSELYERRLEIRRSMLVTLADVERHLAAQECEFGLSIRSAHRTTQYHGA